MGNCFSKTKCCRKVKRTSKLQTPDVVYHKIPEITEECNTLKLFLATTQKEKEAAEEEVKLLSRRVQSLENVVRDLQESAENINQLENDRKTALQQLQQKQAQLEELQQINSSIETMHVQTVLSLNKMVSELDEKMRIEEEKRLNLLMEMQRLQFEAEKREKVLAELECVKRELVKSHHEMNLIPAQEDNRNGLEVNRKRMQRKSWNQHEQIENESLLSAWTQNGPIQVYIAKYNYDPFELSPNENPEAELLLTAGDYILVVGDMDEDGFFDGELIDGTQGLVPSNFIQKLEDEDLLDFHAALLHAGHKDYINMVKNSTNFRISTTAVESFPVIFSSITNNISNNNKDLYFISDERRLSEAYMQSDNSSKKSNSEVRLLGNDKENALEYSTIQRHVSAIPYPRSLSLDKQLPSSLQISWRGPDPTPSLEILSYQILVDGKIKALVQNSERTRAMLEGISDCVTHRISVQCLSNRGLSAAAHCTMLIGKDAYPVPSELKVSHTSSTSAFLSWLPGNSNYQHSVVVNGKEIGVVKPGVFFHTLSDLAPRILHKVTVIAKSISGIQREESSVKWVQNTSSSVEFCIPEEVDHVILSTEDFISIDLSIETCSTSMMASVDSEPEQHPQPLIKDMTENLVSILATSDVFESLEPSDGEELKGPDTDEEIEEAFKEYTQKEGVDVLSESCSDSSCTQLSDIPEVEEDLLGSQDSHLNEAGTTLSNQMPSLRQNCLSYMTSEVGNKSSEQTANLIVSNTIDSGPKEFHTQKGKHCGENILATLAQKVPVTEMLQNSGTEEILATEKEDTTPEQLRKSINLPEKMQIEVTENSSHDTIDAQNLSALHKVDKTEQKYISETIQVVGVQGNGHEKYDDYHSLFQSAVTLPASNHPQSCRDELLTAKPKNKQGRSQRPLSDSVLCSEYTKYLTKLPSPTHPEDEASDSSSTLEEVEPVVKANSVRLFIALFDYDPTTMSPNVDSTDEELPFREGQILKVFGHKDADGFYKGENNGRMGYIPCNMVCEIQINDSELLEQLLQDIDESPRHTKNDTGDQSINTELTPKDVISASKEGLMPKRMIAMYDYDPKELSPNVDAELELSFKTGDSVIIYGDMDEDGFYTGEVNNKRGLVPSNFLQPVLSSDNMLGRTSMLAARSLESIEMARKTLEEKKITVDDSDIISSKQSSINGNISKIKSEGTRPGFANPANYDRSSKGGFFSKGKDILKKFTR